MIKDVIPFNELGNRQKEQPGVYPVFGKIRKVNGEPVGEIIGYSDKYGRRIHIEQVEQKIYQ